MVHKEQVLHGPRVQTPLGGVVLVVEAKAELPQRMIWMLDRLMLVQAHERRVLQRKGFPKACEDLEEPRLDLPPLRA